MFNYSRPPIPSFGIIGATFDSNKTSNVEQSAQRVLGYMPVGYGSINLDLNTQGTFTNGKEKKTLREILTKAGVNTQDTKVTLLDKKGNKSIITGDQL